MRVLFLVPYPTEGASNRIRVEQFLPYLESQNVIVKVRPFANRRFYRILYLQGHYIEKLFWFFVSTINRVFDLFRAIRYDLIFIHREAYPFGGPFIESLVHGMGKPIIFDFDDAIFLPNTSKENRHIDRFKNPDKVCAIIRMSRSVIAGNKYLEEFTLRYNDNVVIIPSCVDTDRYIPATHRKDADTVTIGWIGSVTTQGYLSGMKDVFAALSARHKNVIFRVIGAQLDNDFFNGVVSKRWSLDNEISDLQEIDIGIMPLSDDEWSKGKCGFKAILYMACGLPVVASAVGANNYIIDDAITGFLPRTKEEWVERLSALIRDEELRRKMGRKGREKAVREYSLAHASPLFYQILRMACSSRIGEYKK